MSKHSILNMIIILFCSALISSCAHIMGYNGDRENASNIYYLKDIGEADKINVNEDSPNYQFYWKESNGNIYGYSEDGRTIEIEEGSKEALRQSMNITYKDMNIYFSHESGSCKYFWLSDKDSYSYEIECLDNDKYAKSDIYASHTCVENNDIYSVMTVTANYGNPSLRNYGLTRLSQIFVGRDILLRLNPTDGSNEIVYDTIDNNSRIVGFIGTTVFVLQNNVIYEVDIREKSFPERDLSKEDYRVFTTISPKTGEDNFVSINFDWEGNTLYIIDDSIYNHPSIYSYTFSENTDE